MDALDKLVSRDVLITILLALHYGKVLEKCYVIASTPKADPVTWRLLGFYCLGSVTFTWLYIHWRQFEQT